MATRTASAVWDGGGLKAGKGTFKTAAGIGGQYNFGSRFENGVGSNPEELLAAAHAACYSMALAASLEKEGKPPKRVETDGACTVDMVDGKPKITTMKLTVRATVPGMDPDKFQQVARATKDGCPVSGALKALDIQLDARLV